MIRIEDALRPQRNLQPTLLFIPTNLTALINCLLKTSITKSIHKNHLKITFNRSFSKQQCLRLIRKVLQSKIFTSSLHIL